MGAWVWLRVVGLVSALSGCGGASSASQSSTTASDVSSSTALPAAPPQYPGVVRIADGAAPASTADASAEAPLVVIYDHGSGRSTASFPEASVAAPPDNPATAPAATNTAPPVAASSAVQRPGSTGGNVSNTVRVVADMRLDLRHCYQAGLAEDRTLAGSIRVVIRVGADGAVTDVHATPSGHLSQSVVDCVVGRAYRARFEPPEGGSAVVAVPVTFVMAP